MALSPQRGRLRMAAEVDSLSTWGSTSPSLSLVVEYDPGERGAALALLDRVVADLHAESSDSERG